MKRTIPIRMVATRPNLLLGCDRELIMIVMLFCAVLVYLAILGKTFLPLITSLLFWFLSVWALRYAAKNDPLLRQVYLRSLKYKRYYQAKCVF